MTWPEVVYSHGPAMRQSLGDGSEGLEVRSDPLECGHAQVNRPMVCGQEDWSLQLFVDRSMRKRSRGEART